MKESKFNRRHFLSDAAMSIAAAKFTMLVSTMYFLA
jgi:hypothetical protein